MLCGNQQDEIYSSCVNSHVVFNIRKTAMQSVCVDRETAQTNQGINGVCGNTNSGERLSSQTEMYVAGRGNGGTQERESHVWKCTPSLGSCFKLEKLQEIFSHKVIIYD